MRSWLRAALPGMVLAMVGGAAVRLAVFGEMTDYVKPSMRPWVLLAGVVLIVVGVAGQWTVPVSDDAPSPDAADHDHHHDHDYDQHHDHDHDHDDPDHDRSPVTEVAGHHHGHDPRVGLLLLLPALVFLVIRPGPLTSALPLTGSNDSFSGPGIESLTIPTTAYVGRGASDGAVATAAVDVPLDRFVRALNTAPETLDGLAVRLVGQIATNDGVTELVRFKVFCCAADAMSVHVALAGSDLPAAGTWVEVSGMWDGDDPLRPVVEVATITPTEQPDNPYLF